MTQFTTGAQRAEEPTAGRYDLVPLAGLDAVAETCAEGAAKYGVGNWEKGIPSSNLINHALLHVFWYLRGDKSEDHLGHALWNLMVAVHNERVRPDMVDIASRLRES